METMMMAEFISGKQIFLRGLQPEDALSSYPQWFNDPEVCAGNSHYLFPYTTSQAQNYIDSVNRSKGDLVLAIMCRETKKHVGNISLQKINWIYRSAEFAIVLGDKNCWGKGYGLEAGRLIVRHGFHRLNLQRIECGTFSNNIGMQKLADGLGMQLEGRRRQAIYKNNEHLDLLEYGLLREEFNLDWEKNETPETLMSGETEAFLFLQIEG